MLNKHDTPKSVNQTVELQETDVLILNGKVSTPVSYSSTKSISYSSISSLGLDSNELAIILMGAAAGNFLEWFNFSLFGLMADIFGMNLFLIFVYNVNCVQVYKQHCF